jgi:hypothetical protein
MFYSNLPPQILAILTPLRLGAGLLSPELSAEIQTELRARVLRDGKFTKSQVLYMPVSLIPPAAWFYDCIDCTFYQGGMKTCELVTGTIAPAAWCGLWTNIQEEKPFDWIIDGVGL